MKKQIVFLQLIFMWANFSFADIGSVDFIVMRMDYQTYQVKYLYYFSQPYDIALADSTEYSYHDLYFRLIPAGDFGETSVRSRTTGQLVYKATTIWDGTGEHIFPPTPGMNEPHGSGHSEAVLKFLDFDEYFWEEGDATRALTAWNEALQNAPLSLFGESEYGALVYLHYFSVGAADPTTAEWITIFYRIVDEIVPGEWKNIGATLPDQYINDVHVHFAFEDSIYTATRQGAFFSENGGHSWELVGFANDCDVNVTVVEAVANPWVDCLCEVLYIGTEEYTMIPEDRKGRIYRSMYEGAVWENTNFPDTAVTAIGINPQNPKTAYAGAYNPFYAQWGLYKIVEGLKWEKIMPLPFEERLFRINCIEVSQTDSNIVFVGTDQGLYMSLDNALTWNYNLGPFNISSIQFFKKKVFVTTNGNTRSDGIYVSYDLGETWQIYTYWLFCTEMIAGQRLNPVQPAYFILGDTLKGVSVTRESPYNWQNISETLPVKQVTSLAYFFQRPTSIFAGTVNGVYKYGQVHTEVIPHYDEKITQLKKAHLIKNYPNPFNASTIIQYQIPKFSFVRMKIFNTLGQEIKCLVETQKETGSYSIKWDGKDKLGNNVVSGIYLVRLESEAFVDMKKTLLIR